MPTHQTHEIRTDPTTLTASELFRVTVLPLADWDNISVAITRVGAAQQLLQAPGLMDSPDVGILALAHGEDQWRATIKSESVAVSASSAAFGCHPKGSEVRAGQRVTAGRRRRNGFRRLAVIVLAALIAGAAMVLSTAPARAITGGLPVATGQYGFVTEVHNGGGLCTGSLIHPGPHGRPLRDVAAHDVGTPW